MTLIRWGVIAIVPITALLVVLPLREVFELPKTLAMQAAGLLLFAALGVAPLLRRGARLASAVDWLRPGGDRSSLGVLAFLASAALSTVFASSPRTAVFGAWDSFFGLGTLAAAGVCFFAARAALRDARAVDALIAISAASAALVACSALAQALGVDPVVWRRTAELEGRMRIFGTLGHPNHLASFLAMSLPLQLYAVRRARVARSRVAVVLWTAAIVPTAVAVVLAQSRAGWLAFGAAWIACMGMAAREDGRRVWLRVLAIGAGAAATAAGLFITLPALRDDAASVRARAGSVLEAASNPRREIWRAALGMLREQPLLGVGVDGFELAFGRHRTVAFWRLEPHGTPARSHNEWLHVAATQGAIGLAASAWLVLCVLADVRTVRRHGDTEMRRTAGALVVSLAALGIALATGFLVAVTVTLAAVEVGALAALARRAGATTLASPELSEVAMAPEPLWHRIARGVAICGVLGLSAAAFQFGVVRMARAEIEAAEGQALGSIGALVDASDHFVRAVNAAPWIDRHWTLAGTAFELAATSTPDSAERALLLDAAHRSHATAAALVPTNAYAHTGLGRALALLAAEKPARATPAQVEAAWERGLALDPVNLDFLQDAERAAHAIGDTAWAESLASRRRAHYPESEPVRDGAPPP